MAFGLLDQPVRVVDGAGVLEGPRQTLLDQSGVGMRIEVPITAPAVLSGEDRAVPRINHCEIDCVDVCLRSRTLPFPCHLFFACLSCGPCSCFSRVCLPPAAGVFLWFLFSLWQLLAASC